VPGLPISIVTPTLNAERYLAECLDSIWTQGWSNVEQLVVDGGSLDRTEELVRRTPAIWMARQGLAQSAAINAGLRVARGEILCWLNADDLYRPGTLRFVAERFAADPGLDVLVGNCELIDAQGRRLRLLSPGPYDFQRLLRHGNSIAQPAVFLRRRVFDHVGYLDETLHFGMDYELWLRIRGLQIAYVPRVLAAFRWHDTSKTATNLEGNWHELLRITRRHGGRWTVPLAWAYTRARLTTVRQRVFVSLRPRR
jgi:glycosyltransferase involved in cell wall biosynthesis